MISELNLIFNMDASLLGNIFTALEEFQMLTVRLIQDLAMDRY